MLIPRWFWLALVAPLLWAQVRVSNLPNTVDTNSGNKSASTPRVVIATDQPNLTNPLNVQVGLAPSTTGLISRTYLGSNSANTLKTVTVTFSQASVAGHLLAVLGCSGNYNAANWTGAVTDSASNTYTQMVFGANSTTQFCAWYLAPNATSATTATFTISGSNSANTTVWVAAYDVANVGTTLAQVVDTYGFGSTSGATSYPINAMTTTVANELVLSGA